MKAGELSNRVTLERPIRREEPNGEKTIDRWENVATVWAAVRPLTGRELARDRQAQLETTHEIKVRYRPDIGSDWRLVYHDPKGSHVLQVSGTIDLDNRHRELVLQGVEVRDA